MIEGDLQSFLVTSIPNIRYITGLENVFDDGANVVCLVTAEVARVYTDSRYSEAAEEAASGTGWVVKLPMEDLYVDLCSELDDEKVDRLTMEASVPYGRFRFVAEQFRGRVEVIEDFIEHQRQVKETAEIERIAAAAELTDRAMERVLSVLEPGLSEVEIGLEVECFMRKNGAEEVAFAPIVASGPNSSRPHAGLTDRVVGPGDFVTIDIGARVGGYCADMTRTVVIGAANDRQRAVYEAVREANEAGIAAARAGISGVELDLAAREVLREKGFAEQFTHGLGHGVGLNVHELPHVSVRGRDPIRAGSVVTIEPGVYVPGFGGVRIEDLIVIEDGGCTVLSKSPKRLIEL